MKTLQKLPFELVFWIMALALLATAKPVDHLYGRHFILCPLANMGFDWCPGCGLGRSITQLFHGNVSESLKLHWFGIPALLIIGHRTIVLIKRSIYKKFNLKKRENNYV